MNGPSPEEIAASWRLVDAIRVYATGFTAVFDRRFGTDYMADEQLFALDVLRSRDSTPVAVLADATGLANRDVLQFMRELAARGLVVAERSPEDRRQRVFRFSNVGAAAVRGAVADLETFFAESAPLAAEVVRLSAPEGLAEPGVGSDEPEPSDLWDLAVGISRIGQALSRAMVDRLGAERERMVRGRRIVAIIAICSRPDHRPSTLAVELGLSPAGATYLIDVLERDGLVVRERDIAGDRRGIRIVATAEGLAATAAATDALQDITPLVHAHFTRLAAVTALA